MKRTVKKNAPTITTDKYLEKMDDWPQSWMGTKQDLAIGLSIVGLMKPFVIALSKSGLKAKTISNHLNNLWVIGGEIIREINYHPELMKKSALQLLQESIMGDQATLVSDFTEGEQSKLDATARKLRKHLNEG